MHNEYAGRHHPNVWRTWRFSDTSHLRLTRALPQTDLPHAQPPSTVPQGQGRVVATGWDIVSFLGVKDRGCVYDIL